MRPMLPYPIIANSLGCLHQNLRIASRCNFDPCVCIKEPTECLTIKVDEKTYKVIEQRAGSSVVGDQAARMLTIHHVLGPSCPCAPSVYPSEPTDRLTIETEINKDTYSGVFAGHGVSAEDQASRILAAHARIPEPRPGWR